MRWRLVTCCAFLNGTRQRWPFFPTDLSDQDSWQMATSFSFLFYPPHNEEVITLQLVAFTNLQKWEGERNERNIKNVICWTSAWRETKIYLTCIRAEWVAIELCLMAAACRWMMFNERLMIFIPGYLKGCVSKLAVVQSCSLPRCLQARKLML